MLSQRVLGAAWSLPVLVIFLWLGQPWFTFLLALMAFIAIREFYRLVLAEQPPVLRLFGQAWTVLFVLAPLANNSHLVPLLATTAVTVSLLLGLHQPGYKALLGWSWNLAGIFYVGWLLSHYALIMNLDRGKELAALLLFSTFACDTAAYFAGGRMGRKRMAPSISPGKTWEGATGGFLAAVAVTVFLGNFLKVGIGYWHLFVLGSLVGLLAQIGDLAESMVKRSAGVKDTGTLLSGHGGVLDRIDSVLFVGAGAYYYIILVVL